MEVLYIDHPHHMKREELPPVAMALGYFDGVHLGHQKVINGAKKAAEEMGIKSAVMSFHPHPSVVLGKTDRVEHISSLEDKIQIIDSLGIDYFYIVRFTEEFANLLPQEFVDQYLIGLNVRHVAAGFDYSYGRMGKGKMETLPFHSRQQFSFSVIEKLQIGEEKISSTLIRENIRKGRMELLPKMLGRVFKTTGKVVHGEKRGRTIGFPTANIEAADESMLPPTGVYAVKMTVANKTYQGVCNVGYKPTFHKEQKGRPTVEVFLFDFKGDIYGEIVTVEWYLRLRSEKRFSGIEELTSQIEKDKQNAISFFHNPEKHIDTCILS
ncbi:bifunctional riboflavin kinase/FAD synthetase [Bacillus benzoevorans]|uniref:Riboflavin biosynthesis protein n=1 Tax=Bacillus benzoevorans TaxID=1456 RepID=A0A7X0HN68_9BACI|nr:riboflavin kinase/FMN adenylyltransferase [Bacillus benzoevorans]